jgi:hypothetical protein
MNELDYTKVLKLDRGASLWIDVPFSFERANEMFHNSEIYNYKERECAVICAAYDWQKEQTSIEIKLINKIYKNK